MPVVAAGAFSITAFWPAAGAVAVAMTLLLALSTVMTSCWVALVGVPISVNDSPAFRASVRLSTSVGVAST